MLPRTTSSRATDRLAPHWVQRCASGLFSPPHFGQNIAGDDDATAFGASNLRAGIGSGLVRALAPFLWSAGLFALSRWEAAVRALPALAALRGPLGGLLLAA